MQPINIKTSESNKAVVESLTRKILAAKENLIARIALCYSLSTRKKFSPAQFNMYDSKGKEYKENVLFDSERKDFYIALVCQHYGIDKENENLAKYVKLHIDHGLEGLDKLFRERQGYDFFAFLKEHLEKGLEAMSATEEAPVANVKNNNLGVSKSGFGGLIPISVGTDVRTGNEITIEWNSVKKYTNQHMAVAGKSGSGKTEFAMNILRQIVGQSNGNVNYIFLDFKGLTPEDKAKRSAFFSETRTQLVSAPSEPFPMNPLAYIDTINEVDRSQGINKFVDTMGKYANLGSKQKKILKDATKDIFNTKEKGFPTFKEIYDKVCERMDGKEDTLTSIMDKLGNDYNLFDFSVGDPHGFLNGNYYLSLSSGLDNTVRQTCVFLILDYITQVFSNMSDTETTPDGYRAMRYVVAIDEAHVLFGDRKSSEALENMLRTMRSKGVAILMLSQGIKEFCNGSFNFNEQCSLSFLLLNSDKDPKNIAKFLNLSDKECTLAMRRLESMQPYYALSNIREFEKAEMFKLPPPRM